MITLCMDTSHIFLALALFDGEKLLAEEFSLCPKKQSEMIFPSLITMMDKAQLKPMDIDQVVISEGPGSYTGVRIAMSIAKVICALRDIPLYTINTLHLYAGLHTCRILLDARSKRAYTARFQDGEFVEEASVKEISEIELFDEECIGDAQLIGLDQNYPNFIPHFMQLKTYWKIQENVHLVVPEYLKSQEEYMVKK